MPAKRRPISRALRVKLPDVVVGLLAGLPVEHTDENRRLLGDIVYFDLFAGMLNEDELLRIGAAHSKMLNEWLKRRRAEVAAQ